MEEEANTQSIVVAIDGPAGAGKSSVSQRLAELLGYELLDTGALYRAVALTASRDSVSWQDAETLAGIAGKLDVQFQIAGQINRVYLSGEDVTEAIRTAHISEGASQVSAFPRVRAALLDLQRRRGKLGGVVAEGRDVGTVVFPGAEIKFFLTATPEVRAQRRYLEQGDPNSFEQTLEEIRRRDERDSNRAVAPLKPAADAIVIDSSQFSLDQVVRSMMDHIRTRGLLR